jgi:polysaccharide biosynthesis protein PslJ
VSEYSLRLAKGAERRTSLFRPIAYLAAIAIAAYASFAGQRPLLFVAFATVVALASAPIIPRLLGWHALLAFVILLILFVPVRVYSLPATLPFNLEPYRLVVAFVAVGWLLSLLVDRRVRLRGTGVVDLPLAAFTLVAWLSLIVNRTRMISVEPEVTKRLLFFASFGAVLYITVSVVRSRRHVDFLVKTLVLGGGVLGLLALMESRTGYNVFDHLTSFVPVLKATGAPVDDAAFSRDGRMRVIASSQHPIALGAMFVMLLPLALYLARTHGGKWWLPLGMTFAGTFASFSRTPVLMLTVVMLVFIWLRPRDVLRLWPALLPLLIAVHFALPGTLGALKGTFMPAGGLVQEQKTGDVGSGRVSTLGPALHAEFWPNPLLGEGFATRVTRPSEAIPVPNAPILDDQWLGTLLETGIVGAGLLTWMFLRFIRRIGREAKREDTWRGFLLACIAASVAAYGVSMFTYDTFAFIQVTFLLFVLIGLGSIVFRLPVGDGIESPRPA